MVESVGVLPPARRKKRKPKAEGGSEERSRVPLTVFSVVFADLEFGDPSEAGRWLDGLGPDGCDDLLERAFASLDRLLATQAAATGRPYVSRWGEEDALAARVGYADGNDAYAGTLAASLAIDVRGGAAAPRRERLARSAPLRRVAAVFRSREEARASELLVPRARSDLDAGRLLEAAAVIEVAVALVMTELGDLAEDREHLADLAALEDLMPSLSEVTERVVDEGAAWPGLGAEVDRAVTLAERVIRRVQVLDP